MKKIIRLSENQLINVIKKVISKSQGQFIFESKNIINENFTDIKQGYGGDPYQYAKKDGKYYYAKKGTNNWIEQKNAAGINAIKTIIYNEKPSSSKPTVNTKPSVKPVTSKPTSPTQNKPVQTKPTAPTQNKPVQTKPAPKFCPTINGASTQIYDINGIYNYYVKQLNKTGNSVWTYVNNEIEKRALNYNKTIKDDRISCQIALNCVRPLVRNFNLIVVDTLQQLIYLFGPQGNFIAKDAIISGKNKQSADPKTVANALLTWEEAAQKNGFKWVSGKGYVDQTGKNRKYDTEIIYDWIDKNQTRFTPAGVYGFSADRTGSEYAGGSYNIRSLVKGNKELSNAVHGYYKEQKRSQALQAARNYLGDVTNPEAKKQFQDAVSSGRLNLDMSYGCINLSEQFLNILKNYWDSAKVYVISESSTNYLVNNPVEYFDKNMNSQSCPSPQALGADMASNFDGSQESEQNVS